jgi:hypothetical protein
MERTIRYIKVWFWARDNGSVPDDVQNGASEVNTDNWVRDVKVFAYPAKLISLLGYP